MPKKKVAQKPLEVVNPDAALEVAPTDLATEVKVSFDVYNSSNGYVRTYSLEDHGEDAEKLAHQYAGKIGGSVR